MPDPGGDKKKDGDALEKGGFRFHHIFVVMGLLLALLAFVSHDKRDFAVLEGGCPGPVGNWIGPAGAFFCRTMFYLFGVASIPIIAILGVCLLRPIISIPVSRKGYVGSLILMFFGIIMLFGLHPEMFCVMTDYLGIGSASIPASALSGGVIGQRLAAPLHSVAPGLVTGVIGGIGTFVVAMAFLLCGVIFVWICDWQPILSEYLHKKSLDILEDNPLDELREKQALEDEKDVKSPTKQNAGTPPGAPSDMDHDPEDPSELTLDAEEDAEDPDFEEEALEDEKVKAVSKKSKQSAKAEEPLAPPPTLKKVKQIGNIEYVIPPVSLLDKGKEVIGENSEIIDASKKILQATLDSFKIDGQVVDHVSGPRVTRFEISLSPGIKVDRVTSIVNNISMDLKAESIRIQAPIPGKNTIGIEVPNSTVATIPLRCIMESDTWKNSKAEIPVILGKDVSGKISILDLAKAPHLLIAGATGSGKSVCIHTIILSMLYRFSPFDLKLIMVDPKMVEFNFYSALPHLITPVVTKPQKVPVALHWAVNEMERRYKALSHTKTRNLHTFNNRPPSMEEIYDDEGTLVPQKLPYLVIIIDELADIMMTDAKPDVENCIARIAQKGRAAGIHIIVATQSPRVTVITGIIKANMPTRIALQVSQIVDSKVILDGKGAEKLLGKGDMLIIPPGSSNIERLQGTWVSDREIEKIACFISDQIGQDFDATVMTTETPSLTPDGGGEPEEDSDFIFGGTGKFSKYFIDGDDELVKRAIEVILTDKKASTSYLQRKLKVGYNKAAELIDVLEKRGLVGPAVGASAKRDILVETDKAFIQSEED